MTGLVTPVKGGKWPAGVLVVLLALAHESSPAAEIVPFRLVDVEGSLELKYDRDERVYKSGGVVTRQDSQHEFTEVLQVDTHSYIYHPNLLKLDAGFGISLFQGGGEFAGSPASSKGEFINYDLRASILEKKPYPMTLFANRETSSFSPTLGERLMQTNTGYGFSMSMREPLIPLQLDMDASRQEQSAEGSTRIVDYLQDRFSLQFRKQYGEKNAVHGTYRWSQLSSASGALGPGANPISRSEDTSHSLSLGTTNVFGERDQFTLVNSASYSTQQGTSPVDSFSFAPDLRWRYSEDLDSFVRYSLSEIRQTATRSESQSVTAGMNYRATKEITASGRLRWNDNSTTGSQYSLYGGDGQVDYRKQIGPVNLGLGATVDYELRDQVSSSGTVSVIGESIVLAGLSPVSLANSYVVTASVVVSNVTRSQTYIDGIDYRLVTIGSVTTIERLAAGNILDGEEVLVDYDYQTGGTYSASTLGYGLTATAAFYDYYSVYAGYRQSTVSLVSGLPTIPLNSSTSIRYGVAVTNYPLPLQARGNMSLEFSHQREEVSPSDSMKFRADARAPFGRKVQLIAAFSKTIVDYANSDEDSDQTTYHLAVRSRPWRSLGLTAELSKSTDTGGTQVRDDLKGSLKAEWRRYRLQISGTMDYVMEKQGAVEQNGFNFSMLMRRDF